MAKELDARRGKAPLVNLIREYLATGSFHFYEIAQYLDIPESVVEAVNDLMTVEVYAQFHRENYPSDDFEHKRDYWLADRLLTLESLGRIFERLETSRQIVESCPVT